MQCTGFVTEQKESYWVEHIYYYGHVIIPIWRILVVQGVGNVFAQLSTAKGDADQAGQACSDLGLVWQIKPSSQAWGWIYPWIPFQHHCNKLEHILSTRKLSHGKYFTGHFDKNKQENWRKKSSLRSAKTDPKIAIFNPGMQTNHIFHQLKNPLGLNGHF